MIWMPVPSGPWWWAGSDYYSVGDRLHAVSNWSPWICNSEQVKKYHEQRHPRSELLVSNKLNPSASPCVLCSKVIFFVEHIRDNCLLGDAGLSFDCRYRQPDRSNSASRLQMQMVEQGWSICLVGASENHCYWLLFCWFDSDDWVTPSDRT